MGLTSWIMLVIIAIASAASEAPSTTKMLPTKTTIPTMSTVTIPPTLIARKYITLYTTPSTVHDFPDVMTVKPFPIVKIDHSDLKIKPKWRKFNPDVFLKHTCPREALVALANWRLFCDVPLKPIECWTRAPTINRCCGKWVKTNSTFYEKYPSWGGIYNKGTKEWEPDLNNKDHPGEREIIMPYPEDYNMVDDICRNWKFDDGKQWMHFTQHYGEYGIHEVTEYKRLVKWVPKDTPTPSQTG
ncbi:hypothetical protein LTR84_000695 [Exophiala bonariae]|uniref:Uncharacterized protein n=1 Tax=Exophiala bonariae TaxID=1690606 RepID=A0AAV9NSD5_9EURO|nr:hypothetical protein LTR84_000695 [Exophiala bonariae]